LLSAAAAAGNFISRVISRKSSCKNNAPTTKVARQESDNGPEPQQTHSLTSGKAAAAAKDRPVKKRARRRRLQNIPPFSKITAAFAKERERENRRPIYVLPSHLHCMRAENRFAPRHFFEARETETTISNDGKFLTFGK